MKAQKLGIRGYRWWSEEEKRYAIKNYKTMSYEAIGKALGKSEKSVNAFLRRNNILKRDWTDEEVYYFREGFGKLSIPTMCRKLGKSKSALYSKAQNDGTGCYKDNMDSFTAVDVSEMLGLHRSTVSKWCRSGKLKAKKKNDYWHINENDLIKFMKVNPDRWNAKKCDYYTFARFKWFQDKLKQESKKARDERWGQWYA